jgi:undecaprenyl-diphosphatase
MISKYFEASILAFVQGFSEFIPVSSSAHLIIISKTHEFNISSLQLDISLHLGSLLAIIFYFRDDLLNITKNKSLFILIILGSIPLVIIGYMFYSTGLIDYLRNLKIIAWTTLLFGILLYFADKSQIKNKIDTSLNYKSILIIGLLQVLAIIPGVSRSGIVITTSRFLNFDRVDSSKIAFYLSIPALGGASFLGIKDVLKTNIDFNLIFLFSIIFSFLISYLTIKYFLIYVKNFNLKFFVYYRIFLALVLFAIVYT